MLRDSPRPLLHPVVSWRFALGFGLVGTAFAGPGTSRHTIHEQQHTTDAMSHIKLEPNTYTLSLSKKRGKLHCVPLRVLLAIPLLSLRGTCLCIYDPQPASLPKKSKLHVYTAKPPLVSHGLPSLNSATPVVKNATSGDSNMIHNTTIYSYPTF
jgi:hypothetical protein